MSTAGNHNYQQQTQGQNPSQLHQFFFTPTPSKHHIITNSSFTNNNTQALNMFDSSPLSDEDVDKELAQRFTGFQQIDELVHKQEELYNQILHYQQLQLRSSKDSKPSQASSVRHSHQNSQSINQDNQDRNSSNLKNQLSLSKKHLQQSQKKTRNQNQSQSFKVSYPNTIPSIVDAYDDSILESASLPFQLSQNQEYKPYNKQQIQANSNNSIVFMNNHGSISLNSSEPTLIYQQSSTNYDLSNGNNNLHLLSQSTSSLNGNSGSNAVATVGAGSMPGGDGNTNSSNNNVLNESKQMQQSVISSGFSSKSYHQVTDRLLTIGKIYEAKKQKMKEELDHKKKVEEDQIVENIKRKYSKENFNNHFNPQPNDNKSLVSHSASQSQLPVEQRLHDQKKKYDQNAQQRYKEKMLQELSQVKSNPQINPKSEKMLQGKKEYQMKVEDRLIGVGQMWKEKKDKQVNQHIHEVENRAYPVLSNLLRTNNNQQNALFDQSTFDKFQNNENIFTNGNSNETNQALTKSAKKVARFARQNFEERLREHMERKDYMLYQLKKKYELEFKESHPNLHSGANPSMKSLDKRQVEELKADFDQRQKAFEENKKKKQENIKHQEHSKWSFTPQINENSKKMITSTSRERLITPPQNMETTHVQCKPQRFLDKHTPNRKSQDELRSRSRQNSNSNDTQWQYQNDKTPQKSMGNDHNSSKKGNEIVFTFKPTINEKSKKLASQSPLGKGDSTSPQQLPRWELLYEQHMLQKQKNEEKIRQSEEQQLQAIEEHCTFKPEIGDTSKAYMYQQEMGELYQRQLAWNQNKQIKLQQMNEQIKKEELDQCTFHPQIDKPQLEEVIQTDYSQLNTKAIEKFLERCNYAKQMKLEQELKEIRVHGSGNKWKNQITKAKAPSFMKRYYDQNSIIQSNSVNESLSPNSKSKKVSPGRDQTQKIIQSMLFQSTNRETQPLANPKQVKNPQNNNAFFNYDDMSEIVNGEPDARMLFTIQEIDTQQEQSKNTTQIYNNENFLSSQLQTNHLNTGTQNTSSAHNTQRSKQHSHQERLSNHLIGTMPEQMMQHSSQRQSQTSSQANFNQDKLSSLNSSGKMSSVHSLPQYDNSSTQQKNQQMLIGLSSLNKDNFSQQQSNNNNRQDKESENKSSSDGGERAEYQSAIHFLHEQLHKIDFSFDQ